MADFEDDDEHNFEIGDLVTEVVYIIPPDRKPWVGIVVFFERDHYELHSFLGQYENLIGVKWAQTEQIEKLPASVLKLVQKAKEKPEENS
jgi:hypothetical protein|tara:strand:- start:102 stop:371 length:270 start_codon:yes stop_codon:yes gene_type:complete